MSNIKTRVKNINNEKKNLNITNQKKKLVLYIAIFATNFVVNIF